MAKTSFTSVEGSADSLEPLLRWLLATGHAAEILKNFHTTHIPRPEEWPVMPIHRLGFRLMPNGFFTRNPALDVPKPE
jgi:hypothetical protein